MSAAERAAARQGLRSGIDDMMAQTRQALTDPNMDAREALSALRAMSSRQARENIAVLLRDPNRANALAREIDRIATDFELRAAVAANSRTAVRQAVQGEVSDTVQPSGILAELAQGNGLVQTVVRALTGRDEAAEAARRAGIYDEITEALTRTRGAQEAQRIMGTVSRAIGTEPIARARAEHIARLLTTGGGALAYQASTEASAR
jgi:hypothetical protein